MRLNKAQLLASACALLALTGCETIAEETVEAIGHEFVADLRPASGGSGLGKAEISVDDATNMLCTDLELSNVRMTAGHIMRGGTVIADIDVPDDNDSDDCDNVTDAIVDNMRANPGAYMVHIDATTGDLTGTLRRER